MYKKYLYKASQGYAVRVVEILANDGQVVRAHAYRHIDRKSVMFVTGVSRTEGLEARVAADKDLSQRDREWLRFERDRHEGEPDPVEPMAAGPGGQIRRIDGSPYYGRC